MKEKEGKGSPGAAHRVIAFRGMRGTCDGGLTPGGPTQILPPFQPAVRMR